MRKLTMDELNRDSVDSFKKKEKHPVAVVLDNVRSMHNVGSCFRTSDAFAIGQVVLCGVTAQPPHREIHKTALGATESVEWIYFDTTVEAIDGLKKQGFKIVLIEQATQSILLEETSFDSDEKYAFVFGNEAMGISDEVMPLADQCVEIPQFGTKHSLNISVSVGIVLWEYISQQLANKK